MTPKHPSPKLVAEQEPSPVGDATTVDAAAVPESEAPEPRSDSEPPHFNPYGFSVVTVPPGLRQEMLQAKLPRLDAKYFEDTVPPNQALEAPPPEEAAGPQPKRKPPVAIVVACLLGAALLIALAIVKSATSQPDPTPPTPIAIAAPAVPIQPSVAIPTTTTPVPASSSTSVAPTVPSEKLDAIVQSSHPAASHPSKPASVSKPTPSALASPRSPGTGTAAPVQTSWVNPR
jgi:hypothetical protein